MDADLRVLICVRSLRVSEFQAGDGGRRSALMDADLKVLICVRSLRVSASDWRHYGRTHNSAPLRSLSKALRLTCGLGPKLSSNPTSCSVALR